jgi:hypothetical protein
VPDDNGQIAKQIVEMFDTGDISKVTLLVAADCVDHQGLPGVQITGPEGFRRVVMAARASSAELRVWIEDLIKVALRLHWRGLLLESPGANSSARAFDRETITSFDSRTAR